MKNKLLLLLLMLFTSTFLTAQAPTTQATNVTFSSVTTTTMNVSWTNGDGASRAAFILLGSAGEAVPVDNTTYTANLAYGLGTEIGATGWYCIYNGSGAAPTITVTGLTANSTYRVMVTEYNGGAGAELYMVATAANNPNNQSTLPAAPTIQATNVSFSSVTTTTMNVTWTNGDGSSRAAFILLGNAGEAVPVDATTYTANLAYGLGTQIGATGWYCIYNGSGAAPTITVTGLTANSAYRVMVTEYNGGAGFEQYMVATAANNPNNQSTLPAAPTIIAPSPANYAVGVSVLPQFEWTGAGDVIDYDFEISLTSGGGAIALSPAYADGTTSTHNFSYVTTASTVLTNGTTYYWRVRQTTPAGTSAWASREFVAVGAGKPTLNPITPGATSAFIAWYPVPYSSGLKYDLLRSTSSNMTGYTTVATGLTNTYYTLPLVQGTSYYVQVRATNSSGTVIISYSTVSPIITPASPPMPIPAYPTNPTDDGDVYANPPTLFWYIEGNEPTLTYELEVVLSTDPFSYNNGTPIGVPPITSNKTFKKLSSSLTAGSTYKWQVRSISGTGKSVWSTATPTFKMYTNVATASDVIPPTPSWPVGNATVYLNPPTLYWYLGTDKTGLYYNVKYTRVSTGITTTLATYSQDLFKVLPNTLIPGESYTWAVRSDLDGVAGGESAWSSNGSFTIATTAGGPATTPIPSWPVGGAILDGTMADITLSWTAYSTEALDFKVRMATSSEVTAGQLSHGSAKENLGWVATTTSANATSVFGTLTAGATYYWQVKSRLTGTPSVESPWSMVASFSTAAGASSVVPLVISPNYLQPLNSTSAVLTWKIPVPTDSHLKYDLQYSKNSDFSSAVSKTNLNEPSTQVTGLAQNSTYYWRVLSKTSTGSVSSYSTTGTFKTSGATSVEDKEIIPTQFELSQNYPNPFNPTTKISYALPQNAFVNIKVYDMLGREVKSLVNNEMLAGKHSIEWNGTDNSGSKVASGAYIYRIIAGNPSSGSGQGFVTTKKMVLLK